MSYGNRSRLNMYIQPGRAVQTYSACLMMTSGCVPPTSTCQRCYLSCAGVLNGLQSSNWKQRLTSMEEVQQQVQDMKENLEGVNSVLIQGMSFLPGWSEKNFQVILQRICRVWQLVRCPHSLLRSQCTCSSTTCHQCTRVLFICCYCLDA